MVAPQQRDRAKDALVNGACIMKYEPAAQAAGQTLPDSSSPVGKIHQFSQIAVTFEPIKRFRCLSRFVISEKMAI